MAEFDQNLTCDTKQVTILRTTLRDDKGVETANLTMRVDTIHSDRSLKTQLFTYSPGTKGWMDHLGAPAFAASNATDDAIKSIGGACQGDVDAATENGYFYFK